MKDLRIPIDFDTANTILRDGDFGAVSAVLRVDIAQHSIPMTAGPMRRIVDYELRQEAFLDIHPTKSEQEISKDYAETINEMRKELKRIAKALDSKDINGPAYAKYIIAERLSINPFTGSKTDAA